VVDLNFFVKTTFEPWVNLGILETTPLKRYVVVTMPTPPALVTTASDADPAEGERVVTRDNCSSDHRRPPLAHSLVALNLHTTV
jgi:hypothetical protein